MSVTQTPLTLVSQSKNPNVPAWLPSLTASRDNMKIIDRDQYTIAIVCAMVHELDPVEALFDNDGESHSYRIMEDPNIYILGRFADHHTVLVMPAEKGELDAGLCTDRLHSSFPKIELTLLVGICAAIPEKVDASAKGPVYLGDVVVGTKVWRYLHDGRANQLGHHARGNDSQREWQSGGLDFEVRNLAHENASEQTKQLGKLLETAKSRKRVTLLAFEHLGVLQGQSEGAKYAYPGYCKDKLFERDCLHQHRSENLRCSCANPAISSCEEAKSASCTELHCKIARVREPEDPKKPEDHETPPKPNVHVGTFASADVVMRAAPHFHPEFKRHNVLGVDMEGGGVSRASTNCIVIKGAVDYGDTHKNKEFAFFAAAAAASVAKAILQVLFGVASGSQGRFQMRPASETLASHMSALKSACWMVPFGRNRDFVGRGEILEQLLKTIPPSADKDDCQRTALEGLGGVGKTQIALEAAFRIRKQHPDCHVFWVPAVDAASFENAYREIGKELKVAGIDEDKADVRALVRAALSRESAGSWFLIIDNFDDVKLFGESASFSDYVPFSRNGSILFTTRTYEAVAMLDIPPSNVITTMEMSRNEAVELLKRNLKESQTRDAESTTGLLDFLANLPLAIKQASAYMAKRQMSTTKYLEHCRSSDKNLISLLSREFEDRSRYKNIKNPVATTWLISFDHISRDNELAAQYLRFMCFLAEKDIPASLLPPADELEKDDAVGILKAYAFISERAESDSFDMHRLVRLAMRNWLEKERKLQECITRVIQRLVDVFPFPKHENRDVWTKYLPHAQTALNFWEDADEEETKSRLLFNLAESLVRLGKYAEAEPMYRQALELREKALGAEHPDTLGSMNNLALVLRHLGRYAEAELMHRQALELREKAFGAEHPDTLVSMNNIAVVLQRLGRYAEAELMHRQTLELREKAFGAEHPDTLVSMDNLALVLRHLERYAEAEPMHRQALELREKALGAEHPDTLGSMNNLALVLVSLGRYAEAELMHRQTLELKEKVLGKMHPSTQGSRNNLARYLKAKEDAGTREP